MLSPARLRGVWHTFHRRCVQAQNTLSWALPASLAPEQPFECVELLGVFMLRSTPGVDCQLAAAALNAAIAPCEDRSVQATCAQATGNDAVLAIVNDCAGGVSVMSAALNASGAAWPVANGFQCAFGFYIYSGSNCEASVRPSDPSLMHGRIKLSTVACLTATGRTVFHHPSVFLRA